MEAVQAAKAALVEALRTVEGARTFPDIGPGVTPPGLVVGVPSLEWGSHGPLPTVARWVVYLVVFADERAASRLFELLPRVTDALDSVTDAAVTRADPGSYPSNDGDLPAYQITVEYAL